MSSLAVFAPCLPETNEETLRLINAAQDVCFERKQVDIPTQHVLHGGMYARTVTLPPDTMLIGTLIKVPTVVITVGSARIMVGTDWADVDGYQVLPASANRKQIFWSRSAFIITMIFPTDARTVEEAEAVFTAETALLLSRRQTLNPVPITEENG